MLSCEKLSSKLPVRAGKFTESLSQSSGTVGRRLHTGRPEKESTRVSHTSSEGTEVALQ